MTGGAKSAGFGATFMSLLLVALGLRLAMLERLLASLATLEPMPKQILAYKLVGQTRHGAAASALPAAASAAPSLAAVSAAPFLAATTAAPALADVYEIPVALRSPLNPNAAGVEGVAVPSDGASLYTPAQSFEIGRAHV